MLTTETYLTYITLSVIITVLVARTLSKNGKAFLVDGFHGDEVLAESVNHLLVVGFYLLNLGFVLFKMRTSIGIPNFEQMLVYLSSSIGFVLMVLGAAHFFNLYVISAFRRTQMSKKRPAL